MAFMGSVYYQEVKMKNRIKLHFIYLRLFCRTKQFWFAFICWFKLLRLVFVVFANWACEIHRSDFVFVSEEVRKEAPWGHKDRKFQSCYVKRNFLNEQETWYYWGMVDSYPQSLKHKKAGLQYSRYIINQIIHIKSCAK